MSGDKRFIDRSSFIENLSVDDFNEKFKNFSHFNEEGAVSSCPRCNRCDDVFIKIDLPHIEFHKCREEFEKSKIRMNENFEKFIREQVEEEIQEIKSKIEKKIRNKWFARCKK